MFKRVLNLLRLLRQEPEKLKYLEVVLFLGFMLVFLIEIIGGNSLVGAMGFSFGLQSLPVLVFYLLSWSDRARPFSPVIYFLILFGLIMA